MRPARILPILAFLLILGIHATWHTARQPSGEWAQFTPDESDVAPRSYLSSEGIWLGLSYATAGAFAVFCLARLYQNRGRAVAGAAGGLALTAFVYAAGCFLLGCCGSPMLAVYLALFGPRFLGVTGPVVFGITLLSVAIGYVCAIRKNASRCACEADDPPDEQQRRQALSACLTCNPTTDGGPSRTPSADGVTADPIDALRDSLERAAESPKCWARACAHQLAEGVGKTMSVSSRPAELSDALCALQSRLTQADYDCGGCEVCHGAEGLNALSGLTQGQLMEADVEERSGWPPLPGDYRALRYRAPAAVCTLTDAALARSLAKAPSEISLVGTLQTENLGIERVIRNILANPNIRFLVLCGPDSRQAVGHLPGQSFLSLAKAGLDGSGGITGAKGKRARSVNLSRQAVEHFRTTVEVVDLIGITDVGKIRKAVRQCAERCAGPAEAFQPDRLVAPIRGAAPVRMTPDPKGYFVIFVDRRARGLVLEHYRNDGRLSCVIESRRAAEIYTTAIERGLLSRFDHAAYLGRELARAEQALEERRDYVQDGAAEGACSCGNECVEPDAASKG